MTSHIPALFCVAIIGLSGAVHASEIEARIQSGSISFSGGNSYTNAQLKITGPQGYEAEASRPRGLPQFRMQSAGRMVDGLYSYSLVAASDEKMPLQSKLDNGRGPDAPKTEQKPFSMYGTFRVEKGVILPPEEGGGGDVDPED